MTDLTKSQKIAQDVTALLRARNPLLWIVTREEARVEAYLTEAAAAAKFAAKTWDVAQGVVDGEGDETPDTQDIGAALAVVKTAAQDEDKPVRSAWIFRDAPVWLQGPPGAAPCRQLRNLAKFLPSVAPNSAQAIIIITPNGNVPDELAGHTTVIEWPLPDRAEIAKSLDTTCENLPGNVTPPTNGVREAAIDAALGLTGLEAEACFAKSLVQHKRIDPAAIAQEKKRVIASAKALEWFDPIKGGLDAVGGLDNLKAWLKTRAAAFTIKAREYGLPLPKGCVLVGVQGCGKSLTAKAIATAWGVPLLKLDLGALKSKFLGESEGNIRNALKIVEAIGPCVLWLDEIEKSLAGAGASAAADGGTATDQLGTLLTWAQERAGGAFIVATSNDVSALPPELLRKGRFDEVFFVDLPNATERQEVLKATLRAHNRADVEINLAKVSEASNGFTGSEIAELVPTALYAGFNDGAREITTDDLIEAAKAVVPLSKTYEEKIKALQDWAKLRARPATAAVAKATQKATGRVIELEA